MKDRQTRIFTRLNSPPLSPEDIFAIEKVNQHLSDLCKRGHVIAYRSNAGSGLFMQVWFGDTDGSLKLRNRNGRFVQTGVSPYTLCDYIDGGETIIDD